MSRPGIIRISFFGLMLYFGLVFQKSLIDCVMPRNSKIEDWITFPEISLADTPNLNQTERFPINFGWMSFPSINLKLMPRKFANKG